MEYYYAQIDENNVCIGVSQLSGEVEAANMIRLNSMDISLFGKLYNNGEWEDVEPAQFMAQSEPISSSEPTNSEIKALLMELKEELAAKK